jgi:hypothetical protein
MLGLQLARDSPRSLADGLQKVRERQAQVLVRIDCSREMVAVLAMTLLTTSSM